MTNRTGGKPVALKPYGDEAVSQPSPGYPALRMRRARQSDWSRRLVQENRLTSSDLIWPIFICEGNKREEMVESMPGVARRSVDLAVKAAVEAAELGIPVIAIFPYTDPSLRTADGREALNPNNLVCQAIRAIRREAPDIGILCDVALDPYTSPGHDGLLEGGRIVKDATVAMLTRQALVQAEAGCNIIAPSDMMDGRVGAIRQALEARGHENVLIMAYTAKYASGFYGPFRDAVGSSGTLKGDKKTYQMDPANAEEALREAELDIMEGADMIMVKPGLPYLDILYRLKNTFNMPTFAYQVSGEYAMIMAGVRNGWIGPAVIEESLLSFKRAGADGILTYFAVEVARRLKGK